MIPYFGSKARLARRYPAPGYGLVVEPFAGCLGYSSAWRPPQCLGIERDPRVAAMWQRLARLEEIPPRPEPGAKTDDLLAMLLTYSEHSLTSEYLTVTSRMVRDWETVHQRLLDAGPWMRLVDYREGSYQDAPDVSATWFIDPPYQHANRRGYRYRDIDYAALAEWCRSRRGQVIVCEQDGADWLPFKPLADVATHRGAVSREVWYYQPG